MYAYACWRKSATTLVLVDVKSSRTPDAVTSEKGDRFSTTCCKQAARFFVWAETGLKNNQFLLQKVRSWIQKYQSTKLSYVSWCNTKKEYNFEHYITDVHMPQTLTHYFNPFHAQNRNTDCFRSEHPFDNITKNLLTRRGTYLFLSKQNIGYNGNMYKGTQVIFLNGIQ